MLKAVTIGSMVLCHLITGTPSGDEKPKITKVLGEVVDISKAPIYIENIKNKEALEGEKDVLMVKAKNVQGVYQISATACMLVRKETEEEAFNRKVIRKKQVIKSEEKEEVPPPAEELPPPAEEVPPPAEEVPPPAEAPPVKEEKAEVKKEVEIKEEKVEKVAPKEEKEKEKVEPSKKDKSILDYIIN